LAGNQNGRVKIYSNAPVISKPRLGRLPRA
jgi:hypothetical protein